MDKKKLIFLISSIILVFILFLSVIIYFIVSKDKEPTKEVNKIKEEEVVELLTKEDKELLFKEKQNNNLITNDNQEYLSVKEEVKEIEKSNEVQVIEPTESNGNSEITSSGSREITYTPSNTGANLNEIREQRKNVVENAFTVDASELGKEFGNEAFTKEVNEKNKKLVNELDKSFDFKTSYTQTLVFNKDNPEKSLFTYESDKAIYGNKDEVDYYDSFSLIDKKYYLEKEENAKLLVKMLNDSGFSITKEELDKAVPVVIENDGWKFYEIRNLKLVTMMDDFIKINKID